MAATPESIPPREFSFDEIKFARQTDPNRKVEDRSPYVLVLLIPVVGIPAGIFIRQFGRTLGIGPSVLLLIFGSLLGILTIYKWSRWVKRRWRSKRRQFFEPDSSTRLWCVGRSEAIRRLGNFIDATFEPKIFHDYLAQNMPIGRFRWAMMTFLCCLTIFSGLMWFSPNPSIMNALSSSAYTGVGSSLIICAWLWPSYFRVVPGRLEIIRFSTLKGRAISFDVIHLREARIVVDLDRYCLFIDETNGDKAKQHVFPIRFVPGKARLAHALFWAALCTHDAPPLPDDRLLG